MFDKGELNEWYRRSFLLTHHCNLVPSEINEMMFYDLMVHLNLLDAWKSKNK